jgi:DNA-binding transcriptional regulator YdaS (Cro superfamily)
MDDMNKENKIRRNTSRQLPARGPSVRVLVIGGEVICKEIITKSELDTQELMQGMYMMQVEKINIRKTIRFIKL